MEEHAHVSVKADSAPATAPGGFPTTHWSVVLAAGSGAEAEARCALETLCRQYWYPLYAYVRRGGRPHHEAEDCTQEFLARLLASDGLSRAEPERGRFRTFVLTALRNFLIQEWRRTQAEKRSGGAVHLPFDAPADADQRFAREIADSGMTPEQAFDRVWALQLIDRALADLRREYERRNQATLFSVLAPLLWTGAGTSSHACLAADLGMTEHAFTVALQRLRRRLGDRLRAAVAETVPSPAEIEPELRYLIAAIGSRAG